MYKQQDLDKTHKVYLTIAQLQFYKYFIVIFVVVTVIIAI